ncbi:pyruvate dehydrogenase protein X component, mitochondrial-like [Pomacea canaliculata]|uniref:pyruvate dehydrogenase protein X component, mitochondrial-like n=1 Tax=Pomacea canaliculata TaxID=400727 RepID=UPI000D734367|nr:pyruvate dehydrogenase protein X component, mitochondrial-like [Pomacea canaliculata]
MSAGGIGGLGRISRVLNGLQLIVNRSSLHHATIRTFYLQAACEATHKIEMPSLSPTMTSGTIVKWTKKEGETVSPGDVLCEIQTDKAVVGFEYEEDGVLAKILKGDNSKDVPIGAIIALIVDPGDDWKNVQIPADIMGSSPPEKAAPAPPSQKPSASVPPSQVSAASAPPSQVSAASPRSAKATELVEWHLIAPSAKLLLHDYNVNVKDVTRTGPGGTLLKLDVLNYINSKGLKKASHKEKTAPPSPLQKAEQEPLIGTLVVPSVDIPLTNMRNVIAKRLTQSKTTIPHAYATIDCSMKAVTKLRKDLAGNGVKVSVNDFIIKAAGFALKDSPEVNSTWEADAPNLATSVDISVAVATQEGLITPIVKNVPSLGLAEIASTIKVLVEKARDGKLKPEEFIGGSFSISNLGMYGITEFTAVINPPQVAILAVGATRPCPGLDLTIDPRMSVTLSYDRRAINEFEATQFLEKFKMAVESPELLATGTASRRASK